MEIISPSFNHGEAIPSVYTCEGPNVCPPLQFVNVPKGAKSLVLIMEDHNSELSPRAHWLLYNIPPTSVYISENSIPKGATQGICNEGTFGYEGPCPTAEEHFYIFRLYALDTVLDLPSDTDRRGVLSVMNQHVIAQASLVGKYQRQHIVS